MFTLLALPLNLTPAGQFSTSDLTQLSILLPFKIHILDSLVHQKDLKAAEEKSIIKPNVLPDNNDKIYR